MEYVVLNGWKIYFHSCFLKQIVELVAKVEALKEAKPNEYLRKKETKLLKAIERVIEERISTDPFNPQYRQGDTLGEENKHWFRAKFLQQSLSVGLTISIPFALTALKLMPTRCFQGC